MRARCRLACKKTAFACPRLLLKELPIGKAPEALAEGERYYYHVDARNAPGASGYILVSARNAIAVDGEHICFGNEDGKWFRKPCSK